MSRSFAWTTTRLHRPGNKLAMGVGALFAAVGLGLIPLWNGRAAVVPEAVDLFSKPGFDAHGDVWVLAILVCAFTAMGSTAFLLGLRNTIAPGTVRHVSEDQVPDVPARPLLPVDADTHSSATHRLANGRLEPDPRVLAGQRKFIFGFAIAFAGFVMWLLLTLRPLGESATPNAVLGVVGIVILGTGVFIIDWVLRSIGKKLVTFDFSQDGRWHIKKGGEENASGDTDDLVALQIAAARHRIRSGNKTTITDALELNLAWRTSGGEIERSNLMRTSGAQPRLVAIGSCLAEKLHLPLLYHGQDRHWDIEKKRSRKRRAGRGSITG